MRSERSLNAATGVSASIPEIRLRSNLPTQGAADLTRVASAVYSISDDEFKSVQTHGDVADIYGCRDQPNFARLANGSSPNFHVDRESAFVADRLGAETFEAGAGVLGIMCERLLACDRPLTLKAEHVVDAARPGER